MTKTPEELEALVGEFRSTLLEMDQHRIKSGGQPQRWNRLVDRLQVLHLQLRVSAEGRHIITTMVSDDNATVCQWCAGFALFWDPAVARPELERLAADPNSLTGFEAEITLREFDAGRLNVLWQPKGTTSL